MIRRRSPGRPIRLVTRRSPVALARRSVVGLAATAFSLTACAGDARRQTSNSRELVTLRVASAPYLAYAPLHVAKAEGIYARYGLDVELVALPGTEVAVPLLVDGQIDVLPGQPAPGVLNAINRGAPIRLVGKVHDAASGGCSPIHIVTRRGMRRPAGDAPLPIRRVSINRQAVMRYLADTAFAARGLRLDSLDKVDIPNASEPEALATGAIDAALAGEPFFTRTVRAGDAEGWISILDVVPDAEISLLFFGRRLIEERPDVGARFLAAHAEALRLLAAGKSERMVAILAAATKEEPDVLRAACWPFGATDGRVRLDAVRAFQRWALAHDLLDSLVADERLWDSRFLDAARTFADSTPRP